MVNRAIGFQLLKLATPTVAAWRMRRQRAEIRLFPENFDEDVGNSLTLKQGTASQDFVENCTERPDIGPFVGRFSARLLRAHVWCRAHDHARAGR